MTTYGCPFCGDPDYEGHEVLGVYDGVLYWVCTKCAYAWPRFSDGRNRLTQLAREYAKDWNDNHREKVQQERETPGSVTEPQTK